MRRAKTAGFTLMELLIVVIIVGILASIALPQFAKMTRRSRTTEGLNLVGAALTAQWVYYQSNGGTTFANNINQLDVDVPVEGANEHFGFTAVTAGPPATVTVSGDAGEACAGITITGTLATDGTRQIGTTGV